MMDSEQHDIAESQDYQTKRKEPDKAAKVFAEDAGVVNRMAQIRHKIMILSGKGGVGKSTVAVNLAAVLAREGKRVGILDVDFHGPSIPTLLHLNGEPVTAGSDGIEPVESEGGMKVMSIGFFMPAQDRAVIWRGPMKISVVKKLLADVHWGPLDYLVIDFPPGTGDEPLSVAQLIPDADGAIVVTTPQDLSVIDVRKSVDFCRQLKVPVLGVIENMSGFVCPHCKKVVDIFKHGGGERMAVEMGVPFLGRIPIEPLIVQASDDGKPFIYHDAETEAGKAFHKAVQSILRMTRD
jgi:ATP-binding protein involved in chromosome partitioning